AGLETLFQCRRDIAAIGIEIQVQRVHQRTAQEIGGPGHRHAQQERRQQPCRAHQLETVEINEHQRKQQHRRKRQKQNLNEVSELHEPASCLARDYSQRILSDTMISLRCTLPCSIPIASPIDKVMGRRTAKAKFQSSWKPTSKSVRAELRPGSPARTPANTAGRIELR